MAAQQFTLDYSPTPGGGGKKDVVISTPLADPAPTEIWVGFGTAVATRRGSEIVNAMAFLMSGIRDRNLIDRPSPDFLHATMVTAVDIDRITTNGRRTAGDLATAVVTDTDVVIAMGLDVTEFGYKVMHETHYEQLLRAVQEWLHKNG